MTDHASVTPGQLDAVDLRLDQVDRADGRAGSRVLPVRRRHHHVVVVGQPLGQPVEADGVDAVVVGHEDPHPCVLVRVGQAGAVELQLFDEVGEVLRGLVPADLGELRSRHHRYGIKVWFGAEKPTREHYEAQVIGAKHVPEATVLAIEVGFHAEHRDPAENERALEGAARPARSGGARSLGDDAVAGEFIDDRHGWQRVSETWPDPDLGDPDLADGPGRPPHRLHHRPGAAPPALMAGCSS